MPQPTDIRFQFAECVRKMGGLPLDDLLEGKPNNSKNADYVFKQDNVIAELKCLEVDRENDFRAHGTALIEDWIRRGKMPPARSRTVSLEELPKPLLREVLKPLRNYLNKHIVGDANKQIKQTKKDQHQPDAKGLLLIANDGNFVWAPDMMSSLLGSILSSEDFSAINNVVYFSVDMKIAATPLGEASFWIPWSREKAGKAPVSADFMDRLQSAWMAHTSVFTGERVYEFRATDIDSMKFKRT